MNINYDIIEEKYYDKSNTRISYGIVAYANEIGNELNGVIIASIHDISSNRSMIVNLITKCNNLSLSLEHLEEVIEDNIFS